MESRPTETPDAGQENQVTLTTPIVPRVQDGASDPGAGTGEHHRRGLKRSRRDRGSTAKERISKMPPCAAGKRSSIYRGVTRHRWTGRYEAHLWDKSTWNQSQNKKGKQVYLGAYDEEEAAARAYDLAALKYWGPGTLINFPLSDYTRDVEEMQNVTREEYLASLRRKSSGFSRGVSKYRGVARQHFNGRWEARVGRVFGNKYLYLGTYGSQEEAAAAYDMATMEYRGVNTVTNFDLSRYIRWLRPGHNSTALHESNAALSPNTPLTGLTDEQHGGQDDHPQSTEPSYQLPSLGLGPPCTQKRSPSSPAALSLLLQSPMFKQMLERASAAVSAAAECDSFSTDPSEVSHRMDPQSLHHHHQQQVDKCDHYSPCQWGQQEQQVPSPVEDDVDGAVYHSQDESTSYHPSVTSNYHHQNIVGHQQHLDHYRAELEGSVVYHSQDLHEPTSYHHHQSVPSDYQQDVVGHYVELPVDDHKQHREHLRQQQHQYPELHGSHHQHALQHDHHLDEAFDHHGGLVPWLGGVGAIQ